MSSSENSQQGEIIDRACAAAGQIAILCHEAIDQGQACARPQQVAALAKAVVDLGEVCAWLLVQRESDRACVAALPPLGSVIATGKGPGEDTALIGPVRTSVVPRRPDLGSGSPRLG